MRCYLSALLLCGLLVCGGCTEQGAPQQAKKTTIHSPRTAAPLSRPTAVEHDRPEAKSEMKSVEYPPATAPAGTTVNLPTFAPDSLKVDPGAAAPGEGQGPGQGGDKFDHVVENKFLQALDTPLSTFSIDVDTASYSKVRQYLRENHRLPPPDAVRIEEFINYFDYAYTPPTDQHPFAVHLATAACPWQPEHRLVRIGLKGKEIERGERPHTNLVFLVDVSGSMDAANKLPLVKRGLEMLVKQLGENDRVAIVVYAGAAGLVLPSTHCDRPDTILAALDNLRAGGSTNGGAGIHLAYHTCREYFIKGGVNRVILCSDGDFNVGTTSTGDLVRLAEENAKSGVFLSILGFGIGNHNDALLEQVSNKANGNYAFIDTEAEARKVLVDQLTGTLTAIAKDVKIQVEFNPAQVQSYRLIGYENRLLADRDFNDDKKDAGEIGAGHTVTALYEIVPVGAKTAGKKEVDDLKYQEGRPLTAAAADGDLVTVKLRYKPVDGDTSTLMSATLKQGDTRFGEAPQDLQLASTVALFGMLLRGSEHRGNGTWDGLIEMASSVQGKDPHGYRAEFIELAKMAKELDRR